MAKAEWLGRAHSLPFISEVMAQLMKGLAWLRAGRLAEGIPQLRGAMEKWNAGGAEVWMPYLRAVLAEGLAVSGDLEGGLTLIEESLTQIARQGWEERSHLAEVLRLKGWMLQQQGKLAAAEDNYLASLDCALLPVLRGFGNPKVSAKKRTIFSLPSTVGSPRGLTQKT